MAENLGNTAEQVEEISQGFTEDVTDKKCPNCGATVVYDPETLSMSCPFCGYSRQLPKPEDNGQDVEELDFSTAKNRESLDWGKEKKSLVCKNCGAKYQLNDTDDINAFECSICLESANEPVVTKCGHIFCWPCLKKWLSKKITLECPVCRNGIVCLKLKTFLYVCALILGSDQFVFILAR